MATVLGFGVAVICCINSFRWLGGLSLAIGVVFALSTLSFLWTTRRGKFVVWDELLDGLALRDDQILLDVGAAAAPFSCLPRSA